MLAGDIAQLQDRKFLGQRVPKGNQGLQSFIESGLVKRGLAGVGYSLAGYAKQAGPKWLKICIFGHI